MWSTFECVEKATPVKYVEVHSRSCVLQERYSIPSTLNYFKYSEPYRGRQSQDALSTAEYSPYAEAPGVLSTASRSGSLHRAANILLGHCCVSNDIPIVAPEVIFVSCRNRVQLMAQPTGHQTG